MMNKKKVYTIYTLANPINGHIFYVGATLDMQYRIAGHLGGASKYNNSDVRQYVKSLKIKPVIEIVECVKGKCVKDISHIESYWIDQFRQWGFELLNVVHNLSNKKSRVLKEGVFKLDRMNVSFNSKSHIIIRDFCSKKGYNLGVFCEKAALTRVLLETEIDRQAIAKQLQS